MNVRWKLHSATTKYYTDGKKISSCIKNIVNKSYDLINHYFSKHKKRDIKNRKQVIHDSNYEHAIRYHGSSIQFS